MATTPNMSERRTAVRMLQAPCLEGDVPGTRPCPPASPRGCPTAPPQPAALVSQASRRRSACFLLPPTEIIESFSGDLLHANSIGANSTAPASPVLLQRRVAHQDSAVAAADTTASNSPTGAANGGGCGDPDGSPLHLSVPLTLLSLHNGGARHSPRTSRDASPVATLLVSREGSFVHPGDGDGADDPGVGGGSGDGASGGKRAFDRSSNTGASPPRRTSSMMMRSAPLPAAAAAAAAGPAAGTAAAAAATTASSSVRASVTVGGTARGGGAATTTPPDAPTAAGVAGAKAGPPLAAATTAAASSGVASGCSVSCSGSGSSGGAAAAVTAIPLPAHLCTHRPPTPVCKEDDLMASMRHMASPSRRRSRFASAADSSLMAAAAAAIAAEEAGLLDPPQGAWSCNGMQMVSEPRTPRRATLGSMASDCGAGGESARSTLTAAAGTEFVPRLSSMSMSMTWRTASQLVPVPEEPLRPQSREPTPLPSAGSLPNAAAPAAPSAVAFNAAGSFPRLATPGPGLVIGPGGVHSRRFRSSGSHYVDCLQEQPAGPPSAPSSRTSASAAMIITTTTGEDQSSGPDGDDALSSFMRHSFTPAPGTPAVEKRCPVAPPAEGPCPSLGLGLGPGAVMEPGLAAGARITAR